MNDATSPDRRLGVSSLPHRAFPARATIGSIVLLTSLVMVAQLSTSLYIPSLPSLADALVADPAEVKMTMTAFLFTYALAQLLYGPVSDRFGRRPVLFAGLADHCKCSQKSANSCTVGEDAMTSQTATPVPPVMVIWVTGSSTAPLTPVLKVFVGTTAPTPPGAPRASS